MASEKRPATRLLQVFPSSTCQEGPEDPPGTGNFAD